MNEALLNELLNTVKAEVQVDFDDDDKKLLNHIKNGCAELIRLCGVEENDFEAGGRANALLLNYVRRAYDGDLTNFRNDYKSEIMTLKAESEVSRYEAKSETESL